MPIRKLRGPPSSEDTLWREPGSLELMDAIRSVWDFADRTIEPKFPPGVYKHRSIEDAKALRQVWEAENFRRYWERQANAALALLGGGLVPAAEPLDAVEVA